MLDQRIRQVGLMQRKKFVLESVDYCAKGNPSANISISSTKSLRRRN
jgi:hypothetical protein